MKRKLFLGILGIFLALSCAGGAWSDETKGPCTIMKPDRETRLRWIHNYEMAPKAYIDKSMDFSAMPGGSLSLLSYLQYTPSERNQGSCGNCWAWAGTGAMEIALDVQENILDRLSVQFIGSCNTAKSCCDGGWLSDLASFYASEGYTIPWSNTNANWQNGDGNCNVSCGSIAASPNYGIASIEAQTTETQSVSQAQAIANIKNVLNQNKAVWFAWFLPTDAGWDTFRNFWNTQGETVTTNLDYGCGRTWDSGGGGHAVLCVGYNDDDPGNSYWIMLNSWGTSGGDRPNGIFRLDMDMDYGCTFYDDGWYWSYYWQALDVSFNIGGQDIYVESSGTCNGNTPCYSTIQSAVDAASSGNTIKIAGGTYPENTDLNSSSSSTPQGGLDASLLTATLMPPIAVEDENVIEEMTIIQLQREKDIDKEYFLSLNPPESDRANGNCAVVDTITAPDDDTEGLAWDNGYLWASEGGYATTYPGVIFKINTTGNILTSFDAPGQSSLGSWPNGLAFDGTYLWSVDFLDDKIYKLSKSGAVIGSIPAPSGIASGLAWDGTNLWVSEWLTYKIHKLNPENGQILLSFNGPDFGEEYPYGLAWDGSHLWVSNSNGIYMLDPATGAVLESCNDSAFKYGRAYGMTWDGQYLWGGSWVSKSIIKIDVPTSDNTSKDLTLSGGWDATFTTQSSETTLNTLTLSNGCAVVDKLTLTSAGSWPTISYSGSDPYGYGTVQIGASSTHAFTIQNTGSATLNISGASVSGTGFSVVGSVPSSISAGGSDTITVGFSPSYVGSYTGTLSINSDDPDTPTLNIGLGGTGDSAPIQVASIVFYNNLLCGGSSFTATLTIDGKALSSVSGTYSDCKELDCGVSLDWNLYANSGGCGIITGQGSMIFDCDCLYIFMLSLYEGSPTLYIYKSCPGDCSDVSSLSIGSMKLLDSVVITKDAGISGLTVFDPLISE